MLSVGGRGAPGPEGAVVAVPIRGDYGHAGAPGLAGFTGQRGAQCFHPFCYVSALRALIQY